MKFRARQLYGSRDGVRAPVLSAEQAAKAVAESSGGADGWNSAGSGARLERETSNCCSRAKTRKKAGGLYRKASGKLAEMTGMKGRTFSAPWQVLIFVNTSRL